jgi:hypothetical protein
MSQKSRLSFVARTPSCVHDRILEVANRVLADQTKSYSNSNSNSNSNHWSRFGFLHMLLMMLNVV